MAALRHDLSRAGRSTFGRREPFPIVTLHQRSARTIAVLLAFIRSNHLIHAVCLRIAAAVERLPWGARLLAGIRAADRPVVVPYADWVTRFDRLDDADRREIARHIATLPIRPVFSVIMAVGDTDAGTFRAGIDSVRGQLYPHAELCLALEAGAARSSAVADVVSASIAADPRIRVADGRFADAATATNAAFALAGGDYAVLFDPRHLLSERALYEMAVEIVAHPDADLLYADEDVIDDHERRVRPFLKTGWNPEMMLSHDMVGDPLVLRCSLLRQIGGVRPGLGASRTYDVVLRASENTSADRIRHVPVVLHHSRVAATADGSSVASRSATHLQVVAEHLARTGQVGVVAAPLPGADGWLEIHRPAPSPLPLVSVIIPTRDRADILGRCLAGLLRSTNYPSLDVIIADNDSREPATFTLFADLAADPRVRILPCPGNFNYSAINNRAVAESRGEVLLFLNNDVLIRHADWLSVLVAQAVRPEVGAVGARLLYKNGTVQHAGVILGVGAIEPVAGHVCERAAADDPGYLNHLRVARNMSAVTAACLAMRRGVFDEVGGFDADHLPVAFNDVDLCLKVRSRGYQIICTPQAELTHLESHSRGSDLRPEALERFRRDIAHMRGTWGGQLDTDPYYGPNFNRLAVDYSLAFPPQRVPSWRGTRAAVGARPRATPTVGRHRTETEDRYLIMHIAKTAGTTLRAVLNEAFPGDVFPSDEELLANAGDYPSFGRLRSDRDLAAGRRFIIGHYNLPQLSSLFPGRAVITCLREPYARTASIIGHFWRVHGVPPQALLENEQFLRDQIINKQIRHLAPSDDGSWSLEYSRTRLDTALRNLERVKVVGIQERFPQFLGRLAADLRLPPGIALDRRENVRPMAIDAQLAPYAGRIRELIADDLELYRQVCLRAGGDQVP